MAVWGKIDFSRRILCLDETDRWFAMAVVGGMLGLIVGFAVYACRSFPSFYTSWWSRSVISDIFTARALILGGIIGGVYKLIFLRRFALPWFICAGWASWELAESHTFREMPVLARAAVAGAFVLSVIPFLYKREWNRVRQDLE